MSLPTAVTVIFAASFRSYPRSRTTGGFPGPTPYAGVPLEYAAFTIPLPPVAITRSHASISACEFASVTSLSTWIRSAGAPHFTIASRMRFTVWVVDFAARGAGETMIAFFPFTASMKFPSGVTFGFVAGVTHAITPTGCATSIIPVSLFSLMIPTDFLSLRYAQNAAGVSVFLQILSS